MELPIDLEAWDEQKKPELQLAVDWAELEAKSKAPLDLPLDWAEFVESGGKAEAKEDVDWEAAVDEAVGIFDEKYQAPGTAPIHSDAALVLDLLNRPPTEPSSSLKQQIQAFKKRASEIDTIPQAPDMGILPEDFLTSVLVQTLDELFKSVPSTRAHVGPSRSPISDLTEDEEEDISAPSMFHSSFEFEAQLLVQAGPRCSPLNPEITINSPACRLDNGCVGLTGCLRGLNASQKGAILMSWMSPADLDHHLRTGEVRGDRYLCLLDARRLAQKAVLIFQTHRESVRSDLLLQSFYNSVDTPGEYQSSVCIMPQTYGKWNGFRLPMAMFRHDLLRAYFDAEGVMHVDQSLMQVPRVPIHTGVTDLVYDTAEGPSVPSPVAGRRRDRQDEPLPVTKNKRVRKSAQKADDKVSKGPNF